MQNLKKVQNTVILGLNSSYEVTEAVSFLFFLN